MNKIRENMQKKCKTGYQISKLIWVAYLILTISYFIYTIVIACLPENAFSLETTKSGRMITNNVTHIFFSNSLQNHGEIMSLKTAHLMSLIGIIIAVLIPWGLIIYWIKDTLYNFAFGESPFQKESADNIKKISYVVLICAVIAHTFPSLLVGIFAAQNLAVHFQIDIGGILIAGLIYICGAIFDYACRLQNEYDETL